MPNAVTKRKKKKKIKITAEVLYDPSNIKQTLDLYKKLEGGYEVDPLYVGRPAEEAIIALFAHNPLFEKSGELTVKLELKLSNDEYLTGRGFDAETGMPGNVSAIFRSDEEEETRRKVI